MEKEIQTVVKTILEKLKLLRMSGDIEVAHVEADKLLCELLIELGYKEVVDAWEEVDKWYA